MINPHVHKAEDGSYSIEWVFSGHRFGISLEKEVEDSAWYMVSACDKRLQKGGPLPDGWNQVLYELMERTHD